MILGFVIKLSFVIIYREPIFVPPFLLAVPALFANRTSPLMMVC